jgi:hypothetical protein
MQVSSHGKEVRGLLQDKSISQTATSGIVNKRDINGWAVEMSCIERKVFE